MNFIEDRTKEWNDDVYTQVRFKQVDFPADGTDLLEAVRWQTRTPPQQSWQPGQVVPLQFRAAKGSMSQRSPRPALQILGDRRPLQHAGYKLLNALQLVKVKCTGTAPI